MPSENSIDPPGKLDGPDRTRHDTNSAAGSGLSRGSVGEIWWVLYAPIALAREAMPRISCHRACTVTDELVRPAVTSRKSEDTTEKLTTRRVEVCCSNPKP